MDENRMGGCGATTSHVSTIAKIASCCFSVMTTSSYAAEEELRQCVVQVRARDDPQAVEWVLFNEDEANSAQYFIEERIIAANYGLLQLEELGNIYSTHFMPVEISGVTTEHIVKEREYGEIFNFRGLDRFLALETPDSNTLVSSNANERWLLKEELSVPYIKILEANFLQIRGQQGNAVKSAIHCVDSVLTVFC